MGYTLAEKILKKNAKLNHVAPGDIVITHPDKYMTLDVYTPFVLQKFEEMKFKKVLHPEKIVVVLDHLLPATAPKNDPRHYRASLELANRFGVENLHIGEGICHTIMHEYGYALPGTVVTATDSHTTTYGGGGCFCTGIGHTEMASIFGTDELWLKVPSAIKVVIDGELPKGVHSKDLILKILGDIKADGGQYKSMEFTGSAVEKMSMHARFTVSNMALEAGAKCALFEADEKTAAYFGMNLADIDWIRIDEDAGYAQVLHYNANELLPQLSFPTGVDDVHPITEGLGTPLNEVYIGSCTNGSIEDMRIAAEILQGKKIAEFLKLVVIPATNNTFKEALRRGYIQTFIEVGGMVSHPCCGLCCGMPFGLMSDDEVVLGTNNRNFVGRMGTQKSKIYLASPAVAAASALTGVISDPRAL